MYTINEQLGLSLHSCKEKVTFVVSTVEPLLRGHHDKRSTPLETPLDNVNLNINVMISTPDKRQPLLRGHISGAKGVDSQKGFHFI